MKKYSVTLQTRVQKVVVDVAENEYILDAALRAGLELPHTCLQGWCITCAGKLLHGQVDQSDALRFFPQDERARFVLLCCAKPRSALHVRTHQKEALRRLREKYGLPPQ